MEIQQHSIRKGVVERAVSKNTVPNQKVKSEQSPGMTQSTYKKVIGDGVVLREVCARQAMILLSQVYTPEYYTYTIVLRKKVHYSPVYTTTYGTWPVYFALPLYMKPGMGQSRTKSV